MLRFAHAASLSVMAAALLSAAPAFAQSTGTQTFEGSIVVTGKKDAKPLEGIAIPDTPKEKRVFDQEVIDRQSAGQVVDDIINYMPGVSFQNNSPYGDAGGTLSIHGFDGSRISQTLDGIPMNDSGNYALYPSEQIDSELIERIDVSLGSTDIDSPTASATGSTVNYVMRNPTEDFHVRMKGSAGQYDYMRIFGVVDTGIFTPFGTRALISASRQSSTYTYDANSKLNKWQVNGKIYQPVGSGDDFVSLATWYSQGRGNRYGDVQLKNTAGQFPASFKDVSASIPAQCQAAAARPGVADTANGCGTSYDLGYNPADRFNVRMNTRFTLGHGLILTVDPSYNYTKSNGSAAVVGTEGNYLLGTAKTPIAGFIGGKPYLGGVDLNGDGDTRDTVEVNAPSNTKTKRFVVVSNLIWKANASNTLRLNYTFDHSYLRQTGELGLLQQNGQPASYFPDTNPILDASGLPIEKRNRSSISMLNQVAGEYRGEFIDHRLVLTGGVRAPFFHRELTNYCVSESGGSGYVDCFNNPTYQAAFLAANPTYQAPQSRHYNFNRVLPSAGFTFKVIPSTSLFFDYSQGIYVPSTDMLYDAFAFQSTDARSTPKPETTFNFEGGVRYKTSKVQAELSGWYTVYHNRIAETAIPSPQDETTTISVFSNLGTVHKYGIDGSISYKPVPALSLYLFGSYLKSKILGNVANGECTANNVKFGDSAGIGTCTTKGQTIYALTAGMRESGTPTFMIGTRVQAHVGPLDLGIQAKHTGPRYVNDQNTPFYTSATNNTVIYPAHTPAYTLVDLDVRMKAGFLGLNDKTYLQLNVHNLFNEYYVGGFSGGSVSNTFVPYVYIGTPRTISGSINVAF
ncbi:TonB-dependent receptor [Novosphingobium rosa]|uniref:TonB-dependent receptor n=1 Tax=Novosphingobium rosa TaxID=76978 RepID=UPI000A03CC17|nr:TonB-dependent receptor [Novosphingobium rosa]